MSALRLESLPPNRLHRAGVAEAVKEIANQPACRSRPEAWLPSDGWFRERPIRRCLFLLPRSQLDLRRTFVIRVRQSKAEWIDVKTGVAVSGKTEVFGELESGDLVVVNATDAIRPGTHLTPGQP